MKNIKYQLVKVPVTKAFDKVKILFDTNTLYEKVESIYVSLPHENSYFGSKIELQFNGEEVFPPDFEAKLLATNQSVPPSERFFSLKNEYIKAKGNRAEGYFTDGGTTENVTYPYEAVIYLKLTNN